LSRVAFVTGATGFVGSHLAEQLSADGWRVRALVRPTSDAALLRSLGAELVPGDLGDGEAMARGSDGADTVFHLAAATAAPNEAGYHRANAEGTERLVRAALAASRQPRRIVYLSSYAACGPSVEGRPRRMDDPPRPLTAYGRSKLVGEAALASASAGGIETVALRAPAVYGPRGRELLPYFRLVARRLAPAPGGAPRRLHLVYAPDLASAALRAADAPAGIYAVAEPRVHLWPAVVQEMANALGTRPLRLALPPALVRAAAAATQAAAGLLGRTPAFNREKAEEMLAEGWVCDLEGSRAVLPPQAATPLEEGMQRTVQWYRAEGWL
jgi:nucleoside-diphosphate-sugar epimerase